MSLLRAHKSVFEVVRNALDANPAMSHIKASIGTRFQAEQNPEVIIQQNSFDVNDLNTQDFNTFEISVYCYSNSYTEAASVADHLFNAVRDNEYYILTETEDIEGSSEVNVSTTPYHLRGLDLFLEYYDEDGYEANILIRAIEAADTVTGVGTPDTGGRPAPFFPQLETRIQDLSDVNVSTLAEGNILKYDFSEGEWVNGSLPIVTTGSLTQTELNGYVILSINETANFTNLSASNDISVSGDLLFSGSAPKLIRPFSAGVETGPLTIQSNGDLVIELDENANEPNKAFIVKNGGDAEVFKVDESGDVTVNQQYVLPTTDGNANYFLKTDGSGQLYFATLYGTSGNTGGAPPPAIDTITELLDTQVSSLADSQILRYDSASSKWINEDLEALPSGGTTGQALVKSTGSDYDVEWADIAIDTQYHDRFQTDAETFRSGATDTVELYYTAKADGDGLAESASSDTPTAGKIIRRKIYYSEAAFADPDTGTWVEFTPAPADDASFATVKAALLEYLKARTGGTVPISLKQTWEEVSETAYLLDETFGSGAEAAYSTRQLRFAQTDCMVIRRASDSTTTTIGFDTEGNIDEAAIETFCTGTTCTVETWKDQSGNGNDATQSTPANQPTIYTGGAIVKDGGRAAFTSTGDTSFDFTKISDINSVFSVLRPTNFSSNFGSFILGDNSNYDYHSGSAGQWLGPGWLADPVVANGSNYLNGSSVNLSTTLRSAGQYVLSMIHTANTAVGSRISADRSNAGRSWVGNRQELILYSDDRTNQRTSIEENIGDYFTQNTPLLDTYTGAAAAYSLRKLRTAYTGSAVEVYNGSSYADIGFNVFGELDTVALADHCGSNDGFVSKWYCQSGNSNDAAQPNTGLMPKIYDGATATVVTENGKPAVEFDNVNDSFTVTGLTFNTNDVGAFVVCRATAGHQSYATALNLGPSSGSEIAIAYITERFIYCGTEQGTGTSDTTQNLFSLYADNVSNDVKGYIDQTQKLSSTTVSNSKTSLEIGKLRSFSSTKWGGTIQEIVFYASSTKANHTDIEDNINTFYNIYS